MSEAPRYSNYLSPKLIVRNCPDRPGRGVYAAAPVEAGELVAVWGGRIVTRDEALKLPPDLLNYVVQIEEAHFLAPLAPADPAELINHCCHPSCGLSGQIALVALRRLAVGEEVTFDYATTDSSDFLGFSCSCAKTPCRQRVTADDWRRADVRAVNRGHFSPYLQRRIDSERDTDAGQ
jgi:hypothetical protein